MLPEAKSETARTKPWRWIAAAVTVTVLFGAWKVWDECWLSLVCEEGLVAFNRESKEHGTKAGEDLRAWSAKHPDREFLNGYTVTPYAHLPTVRGLFGSSFLLESGRLLSPKEALGLHMGLNADLRGPAPSATAVALVASPRAYQQQDILWSDGRLTRNQFFDAMTGSASPGRWTESQPDSVQIDDGMALARGSNFRLILRRDGTVWGYGGNDLGQLGTLDENLNRQSLPLTRPVAGLRDVTAIAAGRRHALALKSDGTVWQWGVNNSAIDYRAGYLIGGGPSWEESSQSPRIQNFFSSEPSRVPGLVNIVKIAAGKTHSVALDKNGAVWAWGNSSGGLLGIPSRFSLETLIPSETFTVGPYVTEPVQVPGVEQVVDIAAAHYHTIALKRDGTVWGWGMNSTGQLGVREFRPPQPARGPEYHPPFPMFGVRDIQRIYTSDNFSALVDKSGDLFLMGSYRGGYGGYDFAVRVPGHAGTRTRMRFSLAMFGPDASSQPTLDSEVGLYAVDDALGRVNGLLPGDAGYAAAALAPERVVPVFDPGRSHVRSYGRIAGSRHQETWLKLGADRLFGFYIVFTSNRSAWLRENPANRNDHTIKAHFSFPAANPDGLEYGFSQDTFHYRWERSPIAQLRPEVNPVSYSLTGHGLRGVDRERLQRDLHLNTKE